MGVTVGTTSTSHKKGLSTTQSWLAQRHQFHAQPLELCPRQKRLLLGQLRMCLRHPRCPLVGKWMNHHNTLASCTISTEPLAKVRGALPIHKLLSPFFQLR